MPEDRIKLQPGHVIDGKWRIEKFLGAGGMGTVFHARHVRNGREAALKILHRDLAADPSARERFLLEGYAANRVGHPATVQILDDGVASEGVFLVMELLQGESIEKIAEANGEVLPLPAVLAITDAALAVLAIAHQKGIVHRDFKPENLFLTYDRQLKMLDFGLARVRESAGGMRLTATGVPMGTPAFMPPEQALAHWDDVDARSDVFAVGASMWTLLTGRLVHEARTAPELLVWASTRQAASILTLAPSLPPAIASVIDQALAFDRTRRFLDATVMRTALMQAVHAAGLTLAPLAAVALQGPGIAATPPGSAVLAAAVRTEAPTTYDSEAGRRRTRRWALAGGAVAALLGVAAGVTLYRHQIQAPPTSGIDGSDMRAPAATTAAPEPSVSATVDVAEPASAASVVVLPASASAGTSAPKVKSGGTPKHVPTPKPSGQPCDLVRDYGCKR